MADLIEFLKTNRRNMWGVFGPEYHGWPRGYTSGFPPDHAHTPIAGEEWQQLVSYFGQPDLVYAAFAKDREGGILLFGPVEKDGFYAFLGRVALE